MATTTTSTTAAEIMDRSAVLMNDPAKTDYTYDVLLPFLQIAYDELMEFLGDSQNSPTSATSFPIFCGIGTKGLFPFNLGEASSYPEDLVEIQSIGERLHGTNGPFIPLVRVEHAEISDYTAEFRYFSWESQVVRFNPRGVSTNREVQLHYIRSLSAITFNTSILVTTISSRSFLAYKTASLASMFIGENPERAAILENQAQLSIERLESIENKGRQQIMTRHRPFRAAWKARGGF